jgi:hypothetical protein
VWYTLAGLGEGQRVITAKPLIRKHLEPERPLERSDARPTSLQQENNNTTTSLQQSDAKPKWLRNNVSKLILLIVNNSQGLSWNDTLELANEFCKRMNYMNKFDSGNVSAILHRLTKDRKITRVQLKGKWYYFPLNHE